MFFSSVFFFHVKLYIPLSLAFTSHPSCLSCPSLHLVEFFIHNSEEGECSDGFKGGDDTSSLCSGVSPSQLEIPSWMYPKVVFVFLTSALHWHLTVPAIMGKPGLVNPAATVSKLGKCCLCRKDVNIFCNKSTLKSSLWKKYLSVLIGKF